MTVAEIFKQSYGGTAELLVKPTDVYTKIICSDCGGKGQFEITATDIQKCVLCKSSGWLHVSLY